MLSSHAFSFRQKSRLAISLSWVGGYTNVIALIVSTQVVSHQTGNSTWFARVLMSPRDGDIYHSAMTYGIILGSFLLGAILSGLMTEYADLRGVSSRYIAPVASEGILLAIFWLSLNIWFHVHTHPVAGEPLLSGNVPPLWMLAIASGAMGLQNATITRISGSVVRTTHVTGVITDFGLELVQYAFWWRAKTHGGRRGRFRRLIRVSRRHPTALRLALLSSIWGSFIFGAMAATLIYYHYPAQCLLPPILFLMWMVLVDYRKPIALVKEMDQLGDPELQALGISKSLLPPQLGIYRLDHHRKDAFHHAPNFQVWVNLIPTNWRIIVLVISPFTQFDTESIADLRAAVQRLKSANKSLVISGINPAQYRLMAATGMLDIMQVSDFAPDLEFAIARALEVARAMEPDEKST